MLTDFNNVLLDKRFGIHTFKQTPRGFDFVGATGVFSLHANVESIIDITQCDNQRFSAILMKVGKKIQLLIHNGVDRFWFTLSNKVKITYNKKEI
jgi:hypothetical protein